MKALQGANLALRFILELSAVAITAYWGWKTGEGATRWILAAAAPLAVIVLWALFVAPKRTVRLPRLTRLAIEFCVWAAAALALAAIGQDTLALVFIVVAVGSGTLNYLWD